MGQDDNVKRATENVEQRVTLIRDGFPRSCAHLRDAQLYRSAFERRSTADTPFPQPSPALLFGLGLGTSHGAVDFPELVAASCRHRSP